MNTICITIIHSFLFLFASLSFAVNPPPVTSSPKPVTTININTADTKALTNAVKGIGAKRALAIVKYRENHGLFKTINELAAVPGLGQKFVEKHSDELKNKFVIS